MTSARPFDAVTSPAVAIRRSNVDTDMIIRIEKSILPPHTLGPYGFESLKMRDDGSPDPDCPLNDPRYAGARILLADDNFGCGSSREAAVWALAGMGIRCVIAPSFGDIFFNNCFQNGILPIRLSQAQMEALFAACDSAQALTVDLRNCAITTAEGQNVLFAVDEAQRESLLTGSDEVDRTLEMDDDIRAWQQADRQRRPWVWTAQNRATTPAVFKAQFFQRQ
ncbi:3-isopropylmalate dehydratase small subunit [Variovorax sp. PBS-H4]|uniref:3-isopropylmalate dehydratase small subunit n=1 Tax=Variovorax sp. PBS-H4 TaxID=434008 RepID=UPI001317199E|nr:3-isopropylmalate dehydratase small subunit [Variovorax sp. PBS-H4]VTU41318.1 3-isopropylmalate dehydratase small subunit [Variovorax sp. PBS-H4]